MKKAVIAIGFAFATGCLIADATSTQRLAVGVEGYPVEGTIGQSSGLLEAMTDGGGRRERPTGLLIVASPETTAGQTSTPSNHLDLETVEEQDAPVDAPIKSASGLLLAHISSGNNGSARVVDGSLDCQGASAVLMVVGDVQITLPADVEHASLRIDARGSTPDSAQNSSNAVAVMLLDASGKLVGNQLLSDMGETRQSLEITSAVPFRSMILTSSVDVWFLSDVDFEFTSAGVRAPSLTSDVALRVPADEQGITSGTVNIVAHSAMPSNDNTGSVSGMSAIPGGRFNQKSQGFARGIIQSQSR